MPKPNYERDELKSFCGFKKDVELIKTLARELNIHDADVLHAAIVKASINKADIPIPLSAQNEIAIYTLHDPRTKEVRYVGQTSDLMNRKCTHARGSRHSQTSKTLDFLFPAKGCTTNQHQLHERSRIVTAAEFVDARKRMGLTQTEMGFEISRSLRQIQYYESGAIPVPNEITRLLGYILASVPASQKPPRSRRGGYRQRRSMGER